MITIIIIDDDDAGDGNNDDESNEISSSSSSLMSRIGLLGIEIIIVRSENLTVVRRLIPTDFHKDMYCAFEVKSCGNCLSKLV